MVDQTLTFNQPGQPPLTLTQRINNVRRDVAYIQKNATIDGKYKAVTHDAVIAAVRGALIEHGVLIIQSLESSITREPALKADGKLSTQFRHEAIFEIAFVNVDDDEDSLSIRVEGHAMDNADKAPGKAQSYAFKSAILKMFNLETGENEESVFTEAEPMDNEILGAHLKAIADAKDHESISAETQAALADAAAVGDKQAEKLIIKARDGAIANLSTQVTDEEFAKGMTTWVKAIGSGKKTADDIIAALKTKKRVLSESQEKEVRAIKLEEQQ